MIKSVRFFFKKITIQEFNLARAKSMLAHAEEIVEEEAARRPSADALNQRFGDPEEEYFPLVLGWRRANASLYR